MLIYEESMKIKVSTPKNSAYCHSVEIKVTEGQYWQISNFGIIPFLHSRSTPGGKISFTSI